MQMLLPFLATIFRKRADCLETGTESGEKIMMMESDGSPSAEVWHKASEADQLSELGKKMLQQEVGYIILHFSFSPNSVSKTLYGFWLTPQNRDI